MIYATKEINKIYLKSFFNQNREKKEKSKNVEKSNFHGYIFCNYLTILKQLRLFFL